MSYLEDEPLPVLLPCTICSRTFRPEVLERHVKVCEKTASKKRRVFDSFKNRVSGTELEEFLGPAPLPGQPPKRPVKSPSKKKGPPKWKETHENLIAVLRAARGVEQPPDAVLEVPKHAGNEQCPSCYRFFGPRAFDRHVEFCKEKTARIKMTPSKVSQAQERLEARTKYRAPLSIKPKLTTKEKYSPMLPRKDSSETCAVSTTSTKASPPIPTLNSNAKTVKQNSNFSRQSPVRSSERQRSISPSKKSIVSNLKSGVKKEGQVKSSSHPKVKENLKGHDDLRQKPGTKLTTQDKIRSSSLKLSQLKNETQRHLSKPKSKMLEKMMIESNFPSDDESVGTVESECSEKQKACKWSSAESLNKILPKYCFQSQKAIDEKLVDDKKKNSYYVEKSNIDKSKPSTRESKSAKKSNKQQKPQINDLSVNDESFGIFVAPCSFRPPSSASSQTSVKVVKKSQDKPKKTGKTKIKVSSSEEKEKSPQSMENKIRNKSIALKREKIVQNEDVDTSTKSGWKKVQNKNMMTPEPDTVFGSGRYDTLNKPLQKNKFEKVLISKIPKVINKMPNKIIEESKLTEVVSKIRPENCDKINYFEGRKLSFEEASKERSDNFKNQAKRWRNISEMSTEDLANMSELGISLDDTSEELYESTIWEIAGEQFLKSEDSVQTISPKTFDKHTVKENQKILDGDDFIVLHVTDPEKLIENDADMKLSVSEPCFPYSNKIHKVKDNSREGGRIDVFVFTATPRSIQSKPFHRKRKKRKKTKQPKQIPKLSHIREKTFLTDDFPKTKRRKLEDSEKSISQLIDLKDCFFEACSKEQLNEKKKKFIESLKNQREKIRKWQITANSHIRFVENFEKSIEDDLKELKNLAKGKKTRRKSCLREFKRKKKKELKGEVEKIKNFFEKNKTEVKTNGKNFEYFEINFNDRDEPEHKKWDDSDEIIRKESLEFNINSKLYSSKTIIEDNESSDNYKKCTYFEISKDFIDKRDLEEKPNGDSVAQNKSHTSYNESNADRKKVSLRENKSYLDDGVTLSQISEAVESHHDVDSFHETNQKNSSLENIEEVDEGEEKTCGVRENIEIEDFIISKPNTQKILSKEGDCLDQLFPKPKRLAETITLAESETVVRLGFTTDSVYDLKELDEKKMRVLPQISTRGSSTRMLQKRTKKSSKLPQILVKDYEKKENSMMSLIELWKSKKESLEKEMVYKTKRPSEKLAPLTNKNHFQIGKNGKDSYDPFKQAERQMLALLSWPSTVDIKSTKDISPKPKATSTKNTNLETSPTSAFTKYPNKDDNSTKNDNGVKGTNVRKNLNDMFEVSDTAKKNSRNEKPTYTSADDWEEIFEKHFDLNRNDLTEQMTRSVKSALDGLLKNSLKNNANLSDSLSTNKKNSSDPTEESIITEINYTSTPKQNLKADKNRTSLKENSSDLDLNPNTYRKISNVTYDRITPPEDFNDSYEKGRKTDKANRNSGISLSSLSFCSQISDTTLADEEVMRSNLEIIGKAAAASKTPRRKYARSQSVFDERNKMLFAKTYDPNCTSSDENDVEVLPKIVDKPSKKSPSRNPYPKSVPSHFSRSHSAVEDRCKGDGENSDDGDHVSSPESNRNRKAKLSGDSAYSSLNRRSPRQNPKQNQQEDNRLSSSGSEQSLLTVNNDFDLKPKSQNFEAAPSKKDQPIKMSKFCHECGSKYPVAVAKFCCECGVRRLII